MNTPQDSLKNIVEYLKKTYDIQALILCGSRAVGDYDETSDWDMFAFTPLLNNSQTEQDLMKSRGLPCFAGHDLDVCFFPLSQKFDSHTFGLKLRFSKIIFDTPQKIAQRLCHEAREIYKNGPQHWSKQHALGRREKASRYLKKLRAHLKQKNLGVVFERLCYHYTENLIPWWFGLRNEWPLRPQQTYPYIKKKDPAFYVTLEKIFSDTTLEEKVNACEKLHTILFESSKFKKIVRNN